MLTTLQLTSTTNLDLSKRSSHGSTGSGQTSSAGSGGSSGTSLLPPGMSLWVYAGLGIVGAGAAATLAWLIRRRTRTGGAPIGQPGALPDPSPAVANT